MHHLPDDLHDCLKSILSNTPSSEALEEQLPLIKKSILNLLQSIKQKQISLREQAEPKMLSPAASQIDLNDPSTKQAMETLASQDNLVERSSVRSNRNQMTVENINQGKRKENKMERVKKVIVKEQELSLSSIRQLFDYHFDVVPESVVYILDTHSNIEYELESVSDIQPYSILSIKDISSTTELQMLMNEMKPTLEEAIRQALSGWERQEVQRVKGQVNDNQETETLRKELNVLRQTHETYRQETNQIIQGLRDRVNPRIEIEEAKEITQTAAYLITQRLEALQDDVDQLKQDITQKRCRPSKSRLNHCMSESQRLQKEMDELRSRIRTLKPIWKQMWESELQKIVQEQQFLKDQEGLLGDLKEDHRAIVYVLDQASQISEIHERKKQQEGQTGFKVPAAEGFEGMASVMKEVSAIHVDHDRRLRALDQAEKMRSKALSKSIDTFERELTDFVCLKKLKKTGGAEEVDKQREKKDKEIMKRIFTNDQMI
ncbi:hypothetical protein RO3G_01506 [Rhizopus delemar RA 99-880]|uniref:Actin interacting protein 3 C-terminal domain-containing protein n=1 Tax=Rhizopus delemar (strain RA 99-880 / ATCC MYA-4621 / FGSC 9543 / NRRL 43880) TaxID=246409 RepID=I1BKS2_RHIO9|nr:hypothetical protein RO3G_01506 [Rhizopus delemar RA 99-880]|eukprot:EIE76802.1 hypothetical protein RO3G_01506 [Rhizopus delemar RA 99-880]